MNYLTPEMQQALLGAVGNPMGSAPAAGVAGSGLLQQLLGAMAPQPFSPDQVVPTADVIRPQTDVGNVDLSGYSTEQLKHWNRKYATGPERNPQITHAISQEMQRRQAERGK